MQKISSMNEAKFMNPDSETISNVQTTDALAAASSPVLARIPAKRKVRF